MLFRSKEQFNVVGLPTTWGFPRYKDWHPEADALVVERLKAAGAIMMGKLATHEFAIGGPSFDLPWPPAVNPWGGEHFPGGSSELRDARSAALSVPHPNCQRADY